MIKPEILKAAGDAVGAAVEVLAQEPVIPSASPRRETYYWRYLTILNHETPPSTRSSKGTRMSRIRTWISAGRGPRKGGADGDALRLEVMNGLLSGLEKIRESKGLAVYAGGQMMMGGRGMGGSQPPGDGSCRAQGGRLLPR